MISDIGYPFCSAIYGQIKYSSIRNDKKPKEKEEQAKLYSW